MTPIESIKLSEVLRLIPKPKYVLGTTYTLSLAFFESVVFPFIDRSKLKSCLILCDAVGYQRALTEAAALQGAAQDYMVVSAPVSGSFHSKVWLIVGEGEAALLVGSGNLTQAGFMTNAELFDVIHLTAQEPPPAELLASIRSFIKGLAALWPPEDAEHLLCVETLLNIEQAVSEFHPATAPDVAAPRFLHSFQGPLIQQMPSAPGARNLYVAAPFFGNSLQGLNLLTARYPAATLNLFPAVHQGTATNIPLPQVRKTHKGARISALAVPTKKGAFAHLKLYGITTDGDTAWLCCTSANSTEAAWQGPNIEAALLRSVPSALLASYFSPAKSPLPENSIEIREKDDALPVLHCWATDDGPGLELQVANDSRHHLPLRDVTLTVRAGSALAKCTKPVLFQNGSPTHVQWTVFAGWQRRRKVAICLEIEATGANGQSIRARCLVENQLLLRADPVHRSAWRGALALLDVEGAPELADVAAIFTLANEVFDGNLFRPRDPESIARVKQTNAAKNDEPAAVAVWPPQPDTHDLRKKLGTTALGQLEWFQHILKTFLHTQPTADDPHQADVATLNDHFDDEEDYGEEKRRVEKEKAAPRAARRIWELALDDYGRLRTKLVALCPTSDNAPNIWPATIFAFLSTLAVLRAAKRIAPDLALGTNAELLCDDFLRVMFNPRQQDEDFCCPRGHRYYPNDERFMPLARDLHSNFKARPHPSLAAVLLALIADREMRSSAPSIPAVWLSRFLPTICDPSLAPDAETRETSRCVWRKYVCDTSRKATDGDFAKTFDALFSHPLATGTTP